MTLPSLNADVVFATRWVVPILRVLAARPARFTEIKDQIPGISAKLVTERLRYLGDIGLVRKVELPHPANCQVYELSEIGALATHILDAMDEWTVLANGT